jgi:hypothetical protein
VHCLERIFKGSGGIIECFPFSTSVSFAIV